METGAITGYVDVAQIVLYVFWGFLAVLIIYLRREDKREGYPLESERSAFVKVEGFPKIPEPKSFLLADGSTVQAPRDGGGADRREIKAVPAARWHGAPLIPSGDAMMDGVGPAAFAQRSDTPDLTYTGTPKIVPLRSLSEFHIDENDPDPRGMQVIGADGEVGGIVRDVWVDRAEYIIRYLEVEVGDKAKKRNVLLPTTQSRIGSKSNTVSVNSVLGNHLAKVPSHKRPDVVTRLEEDRICAFYAGGNLYATPARAEPLL